MSCSSVIYVGSDLATLLEDYPATIEFDEKDVASGQLTYTVLWESAYALVKALALHPDYGWLKRKTATVTRMEAGWAKVTVDFEGIAPGDDGPGEPTFIDYSLDGASASEPIETHPNFETFAGTWNDPKNGAVFIPADETKPLSGTNFKFKEFSIVTPAPEQPKAGIQSYETPGIIYTETRTYDNTNLNAIAIKMNKIGNVDEPPSSDFLPDVNAPRTWLLISVKVTRVGDGMKIARSWKLSGPNGWDKDIYEDPA